MMKSKVYVETTVISYLAAPPSRDIVVAAHQQLTKAWWDQRARFELFVSQAVVDEASRGDASVAERRLALLDKIPAEHDNDLEAIVRALKHKEGADGRRVINLAGKRVPKKRTRKAG